MSTQRRITLISIVLGYAALIYLLKNLGFITSGPVFFLLFLGSIGILFYSHFEEPNNFFKYYKGHKKITNWNKSVLFIYAKLIEIDGNVSRNELKLVESILKKDMEENYIPEHFQFLKSSLGVKAEIKHPLRDIFENFGSSYCMLFISNLVRLAASDTLMTKKEEHFIINIAKELRVGNRAFKSILARHTFITEEESRRRAGVKINRTISTGKAYAILGIDNNASFIEVKKAYREMVKINHPDMIRDKNLKKSAKQQFQIIQDAYESIKKEKG
ncbi:DnaJ domain-containing protein [Flavobacteriales bacterium]|nr:DnaJ domain-containing protein [Flavobacteriales bacterium]